MMKSPLEVEKQKLVNSTTFPILFVVLLWIIHLTFRLFEISPAVLCVVPRTHQGILHVLTFHLAHANFNHLISNSISLLFLGTVVFYMYRGIAFQVFFWVYIMAGVWLWAAGRENTCHIGASTLVYGFVSFLFFSGIFRWNFLLLFLSFLMVFMYGSLIWGIFPFENGISWEGHLFGAIAGVLTAYFYRKEGPQQKKYFQDEEEDDDTNKSDDNSENNSNESDNISFNYEYKEGGSQDTKNHKIE